MHPGNAPGAVLEDLIARARTLYRERMAAFPEAAAGHALDHFLSFGTDTGEALRLAEANYRNRPHGDAALGLARAQLQAHRSQAALDLLRKELAAGWRTAELHWLLGKRYADQRQPELAQQNRHQALALNPLSARMYGN